MLIDEGIIRFEDGCWRAAGAIDRVSVPPTIQALLAARLDYLDPRSGRSSSPPRSSATSSSETPSST